MISLLKRRQIQNTKECAIATAYLLQRLVETCKLKSIANLIAQVRHVGWRLTAAQPRELGIGNVVRRVLGVIREEAEESWEGKIRGGDNAKNVDQSPFRTSPPERLNAIAQSLSVSTPMFSFLSQPCTTATPDFPSLGVLSSPRYKVVTDNSIARDFTAEVVEGIQEILDELNQADDQIASHALDHIHSSEIILTHSASITVQKFLLKAAAKRNFTVIHAETYPNDHQFTAIDLVGRGKGNSDGEYGRETFSKTLTAAGITVILVPDSAAFALMSRVNKVLLNAHTVLADGSLVAAAGSRAIAQAAHMQGAHVVVLGAVYQLSPVYPFNPDILMEDGDPGRVARFDDGDFIDTVSIENPVFDFVPAEVIDLYISNL